MGITSPLCCSSGWKFASWRRVTFAKIGVVPEQFGSSETNIGVAAVIEKEAIPSVGLLESPSRAKRWWHTSSACACLVHFFLRTEAEPGPSYHLEVN